jgi:ammonia channel protein AmtB
MVRGKNVLGMLMQNVFALGILAILWVAVVFSLAFGDAGNAGSRTGERDAERSDVRSRQVLSVVARRAAARSWNSGSLRSR